VARVLVFPAALLAGFGRWHEPFLFFAHLMALMPGLPGNYLRGAYCAFTLDGVGRDCHISFGSLFAHSHASLGNRVGIGAYCVLGQVDIGEGTQCASLVQVMSGRRQHRRGAWRRKANRNREPAGGRARHAPPQIQRDPCGFFRGNILRIGGPATMRNSWLRVPAVTRQSRRSKSKKATGGR